MYFKWAIMNETQCAKLKLCAIDNAMDDR
jgi:hypothetical protein